MTDNVLRDESIKQEWQGAVVSLTWFFPRYWDITMNIVLMIEINNLLFARRRANYGLDCSPPNEH